MNQRRKKIKEQARKQLKQIVLNKKCLCLLASMFILNFILQTLVGDIKGGIIGSIILLIAVTTLLRYQYFRYYNFIKRAVYLHKQSNRQKLAKIHSYKKKINMPHKSICGTSEEICVYKNDEEQYVMDLWRKSYRRSPEHTPTDEFTGGKLITKIFPKGSFKDTPEEVLPIFFNATQGDILYEFWHPKEEFLQMYDESINTKKYLQKLKIGIISCEIESLM